MKNYKSVLKSIITALLGSFQAVAFANESDADDVYVLKDFFVVGSALYKDEVNALKSPTPIIEVPQLSLIHI